VKKAGKVKEIKKNKKKKRTIPAAYVRTTVNRFLSFPVAQI
jgi:hypothetical protein